MRVGLELERPKSIEELSWASITGSLDRLARALETPDHSLAIGTAKELVESVGKSILVMRGQVVAAQTKFPQVVEKAHVALERQAGPELADAPAMRNLLQGIKKAVIELAPLRNMYGTGHGRAQDPKVAKELCRVSVEASLLWCRWALHRYDAMAEGLPEPLISDLQSGIFHGGTLADRLVKANLPELDTQVQRRLGVAVAQRAMRNTFMVRIDGIEACALNPDLTVWPASYRAGAFQGLFISAEEQLTLSDITGRWASRVLAPVPGAEAEISSLTAVITEMAPAAPGGDIGEMVIPLLQESIRYLPKDAYDAWDELVAILARIR